MSDLLQFSNRPVIRCLALVILLSGSTHLEPLTSAIYDPDLWWHVRDGDAIIAQHAVPHQGVFSQYVGHPWVAYSWGFEVMASRFYHWFGLLGLVGLRSALEVLITFLLFVILRRGSGSFWQAWGLTAAGMWAMHHCLGLQPMLTSILMFTVEIELIVEARRRGNSGLLFAMPILFLVWANLHIQFIYGLFVLGLLVTAGIVRLMLPKSWSASLEPVGELPFSKVIAVAGLSVLATLIGPYSWHLYAVILSYVRSSAPYSIIIELQALNFRAPEHFIVLLIVVGAFFSLGWQRSRDPFKLLLLVACTLVAFRMERDSWFVCIPALVMISDRKLAAQDGTVTSNRHAWTFAAATALGTILMFLLVAWDSKVNNDSLRRALALYFPVRACDFVRSASLPGPIYNDLNWGGFIIWSLPEYPVAIDGRTDLYGDEVLTRAIRVEAGSREWRTDLDLQAARLVLLDRRDPLAALLYHDSEFRVVYEDPLAVVLTRNGLESQ
ncbi:MAG: hypothetical protein WB421_02500 [Terriglobales bacterium]